jgi:hypothetical protein
MATQLIWGADLYKGFKLDRNFLMSGNISDILPFQMLTMDEKTQDWIQAVADFYEWCGWNNVERKAMRIERNYQMRYGRLNQSDYIVNATPRDLYDTINLYVPNTNKESPLEMFYPLIPSFIDTLRGEFLKRDNTWTVEVVDPDSVSQSFDQKRQAFEKIVMQQAIMQKEQALASLGITPKTNPQQYQQMMQQAMTELTSVEMKAKNFRTTGAKWAEKVLDIHERRYNLSELEPDAFESGLITDSEFWHIDLLDDDFKLELLNPKFCDYHKGPNIKYVSQGDYFLWFDFMSAGDIVNRYGRIMKEEDILKIKEIYVKTANIIVPDYLKGRQGEYYDLTKPWMEATDLNPARNDAFLGYELAYNYMRRPNFDHNIDVDLFNPVFGRLTTGHPQMFRVMRLYWRSMSRIGWLTKVNRDGTIDPPVWVDENYKVTIPPKYDKSVVKEETKDNLIYGEHIDWTWRPEWRHVMKISPNQRHTFWINSLNTNQFHAIYIDGGPVRFQFKGRENPFDSLPPVEGCHFNYINTEPMSFIDRMRPFQIIYNICMNRVPKKFLKDYGNKLAIDRRMMSVNNPSDKTKMLDPVEAYDEKLRNSDIIDYSATKESLEGGGQPQLPTVLKLSTIEEAKFYLDSADVIKWMAAENMGITRQRMGMQKASETATGINNGIVYSETQTEKYFEQHSHLMQRVRQRMLDAAQYYSTFKESARDMYMNEMDENVFLEIAGMDNLLPHYNINLQSKADVRAALEKMKEFLFQENTLPIAASAKLSALVEGSVPKILAAVRSAELEQIQIQQQQEAAQQQQEQQQMQQQMQMHMADLQHEDTNKELDRESQQKIATIRALGGVQSDANKDSVLDAQQNLDPYLKQQQMDNKTRMEQQKLEQERQKSVDNMTLQREKNQADLQKEKIKADAAIKVAKENKNKYDK